MSTPLILTIKETESLLRLGRVKLYMLLREGFIEGFQVGSDWRVVKSSVEKLVGPISEDFFSKKAVKPKLSITNEDQNGEELLARVG